MNTLKTAVLLAGLTALFMAVGYLIGGPTGMTIAFLVAVATNAIGYWNADRIVLGMYGAREVDAHSAPEFYGLVAELARRAGLPMPRVYIADNPQPNAFATGRNPEHAAVCATTGLLQAMSREELAGVMAHELAHVKHRDTLTMTITATMAGAIAMLANFAFFFGGNRNNPLGLVGTILIAVLAPLAAMVVQMAISRAREYEADRGGAEITGQPLWLASALGKLEHHAQRIPNAEAEGNPATAHLFIVNPLSGHGMDNLFSTHPATENRIAALEEMARGGGTAAPRGSFLDTAPAQQWAGPWSRGARRGPWG